MTDLIKLSFECVEVWSCISSLIKFWQSSSVGSLSRILWWYNCSHKFHTFLSFRNRRFSVWEILMQFWQLLTLSEQLWEVLFVFNLEARKLEDYGLLCRTLWWYNSHPSFPHNFPSLILQSFMRCVPSRQW